MSEQNITPQKVINKKYIILLAIVASIGLIFLIVNIISSSIKEKEAEIKNKYNANINTLYGVWISENGNIIEIREPVDSDISHDPNEYVITKMYAIDTIKADFHDVGEKWVFIDGLSESLSQLGIDTGDITNKRFSVPIDCSDNNPNEVILRLDHKDILVFKDITSDTFTLNSHSNSVLKFRRSTK